tara:strand:- start:3645 stop:3989 length:345 start_codon:yes stop_codon:yes gene_type:complete
MILLIVIISTIVLFELYYLYNDLKIKIHEKDKEDLLLKTHNGNLIGNLKEHIVEKDILIEHLPGKVFIKDNHNIFINYDNKVELMKKDIIYDLKSNFYLDVLKLNNKEVNYFYI